MSLSPCTHCGAPREANLAVCRYCRTPFVANLAKNAVPCPTCGLMHEKGTQKCAACSTWLVVQCVFCATLSPHNDAACGKCREPFAGALERFQQRKQEQEMKQRLDMVSSVGGVAVGLLGAVASTGVVEQVFTASRDDDDDDDDRRRRRHGHAHHHHHDVVEGRASDGEEKGFFASLLEDTDSSDDGDGGR